MGNFVVRAFGNGIVFKCALVVIWPFCVQRVIVVDVCGQVYCRGVWKRNSVFKCALVVILALCVQHVIVVDACGQVCVKPFEIDVFPSPEINLRR